MGQRGANFRILVRNLIEEIVPTSTGQALLASLPVTNLALQTSRGQTARTTGVGSAVNFRANFGAASRVNMMAMSRTNWTTGGLIAPTYFSNAFVTSVYGPGNSAAFDTSLLDRVDQAFYRSADGAGIRNAALYSPLFTNVQSVQFAVSDAANPDAYVEQTKWFAGEYFEVSYDPEFGGVDMQYMDASVQGRSDDGTMQVDKRAKTRKLTINLTGITDSDLPTMLAAARYLGKDKECWISLYPGWGGAKEIYNQGAFRLTDSPTFNPHQVGLHKNTMTFEET
jgi:hypothetical protein